MKQRPRPVIASEDRQSQGAGSVGVVLEPCVQQVILPDPVDAKITARIAFALESRFLKQPNRCRVVRDTWRLKPVQPQRGEAVRHQRAYRGAHVALAREALADPVPDAACLCDAAANIGKRQASDHRIIFVSENQKGVSKVATLVLGIALEPAPEGAAREIV